MSFKDGRIGVGKDPIFPLDISGSCRIDGDLILGGRFSDSQGNAIQLGSGSGATSTPDQTKVTLPSWEGGTITTQGLGIFKGRLDTTKKLTLITGDSGWNTSTSGTNNTSCGYASGMSLQGGTNNSFFGSYAGVNVNTGGANTCMGFESGKNITSAAYNTFIGSECGKGSWPTTGDYNTCVGDRSGYSITSGTHNTIIGRAAGYWTTTASHNTFLGYYAGYNNTTGAENVVIGSEAGKALNTGTRNTILGFEAGKVLTSSGDNVMIGARAGINSTAAGNTFVGTYAGNKNTSGNENTSIGYWAGYNLTTGTGNTIMGYQAGYSHTTGHSNVLIGENCGYNHTTPSYNTFIGYNVGMNNNNTTGSNVFIGKSTAYYNNGCYNVALGKEALMGYMNQGATRSGDANVAIGYQAAWRHDGHGNVIIGPYSGNQSTTIVPSSIHDNVCVGIYTGTKLKNSKGNVFIGPYAGQNFSRTTSMDGYNTYVGYYAGKATTTGRYNVAIGSNALNICTTGERNVCIGENAGNKITTTVNNVIIGAEAGMDANVTNNSNVFVGYQAGKKCNTSSNVCIGRSAGEYMDDSGSNNICLGNYAGPNNVQSHGNYNLFINSYTGFYGEDGFIYGNMNMSSNPYLRLNARLEMYDDDIVFNRRGRGLVGSYATESGNLNPIWTLGTGYTENDGETIPRYSVGYCYPNSCDVPGDTNHKWGFYVDATAYGSPDWTGYANWFLSGGKGGYSYMQSGRLGIGVTSPTAPLHVKDNVDYGEPIARFEAYGDAFIMIDNNNAGWGEVGVVIKAHSTQGYWLAGTDDSSTYQIKYDSSDFHFSTPLGFSVSTAGYVGINTTTPTAPLDIEATVSADADKSGWWNGDDAGWYGNDTPPSGWHAQLNSNVSYGDVDANYSAQNYSLHMAGGIYMEGNSVILITSDERIKKEITNANSNDCLTTLRNIPIREYKYKDTKLRGRGKTLGFIAQEVDKEFSMAVTK